MNEMKIVQIRGEEDGNIGLYYARVRDAARMFAGIPMSSRIAVVSVILHEMNDEFMRRVLSDE